MLALLPPVVKVPVFKFTLPAPARLPIEPAETFKARFPPELTVTPLDCAKAFPAASAMASVPPVTVVGPVRLGFATVSVRLPGVSPA